MQIGPTTLAAMGAEFAGCVESSWLSLTHGGYGEQVSEFSAWLIDSRAKMLDVNTYRLLLELKTTRRRVLRVLERQMHAELSDCGLSALSAYSSSPTRVVASRAKIRWPAAASVLSIYNVCAMKLRIMGLLTA